MLDIQIKDPWERLQWRVSNGFYDADTPSPHDWRYHQARFEEHLMEALGLDHWPTERTKRFLEAAWEVCPEMVGDDYWLVAERAKVLRDLLKMEGVEL